MKVIFSNTCIICDETVHILNAFEHHFFKNENDNVLVEIKSSLTLVDDHHHVINITKRNKGLKVIELFLKE